MTANTIAANQKMDQFNGHDSVWLFGYGSLIYKADFDYLDRRPASIAGWTRRFWQGSHDHRGTPQAPGRVVTIIEEADAICHGMAYLITPQVFGHLDHREKNGYLRLATDIAFDDGSSARPGLHRHRRQHRLPRRGPRTGHRASYRALGRPQRPEQRLPQPSGRRAARDGQIRPARVRDRAASGRAQRSGNATLTAQQTTADPTRQAAQKVLTCRQHRHRQWHARQC